MLHISFAFHFRNPTYPNDPYLPKLCNPNDHVTILLILAFHQLISTIHFTFINDFQKLIDHPK
jgi:hypothetical protein